MLKDGNTKDKLNTLPLSITMCCSHSWLSSDFIKSSNVHFSWLIGFHLELREFGKNKLISLFSHMSGCKADYMFAVKSLMKAQPYTVLVIALMFSVA